MLHRALGKGVLGLDGCQYLKKILFSIVLHGFCRIQKGKNTGFVLIAVYGASLLIPVSRDSDIGALIVLLHKISAQHAEKGQLSVVGFFRIAPVPQ